MWLGRLLALIVVIVTDCIRMTSRAMLNEDGSEEQIQRLQRRNAELESALEQERERRRQLEEKVLVCHLAF